MRQNAQRARGELQVSLSRSRRSHTGLPAAARPSGRKLLAVPDGHLEPPLILLPCSLKQRTPLTRRLTILCYAAARADGSLTPMTVDRPLRANNRRAVFSSSELLSRAACTTSLRRSPHPFRAQLTADPQAHPDVLARHQESAPLAFFLLPPPSPLASQPVASHASPR